MGTSKEGFAEGSKFMTFLKWRWIGVKLRRKNPCWFTDDSLTVNHEVFRSEQQRNQALSSFLPQACGHIHEHRIWTFDMNPTLKMILIWLPIDGLGVIYIPHRMLRPPFKKIICRIYEGAREEADRQRESGRERERGMGVRVLFLYIIQRYNTQDPYNSWDSWW